jgi:hypothetical protein
LRKNSGFCVDVVIREEGTGFLVLHAKGQGVGPRSSATGISHCSTKGGAGEDEEGTWISRKSASEVRIMNKYSGCGACEFMGARREGVPDVGVNCGGET